jgi:membrane protein
MAKPLPWRQVIAATFHETVKDDAQGLAAQLSFHFFLSLFAMLLALVAFASFFPLGNLTGQMTRLLAPIAPAPMLAVISEQMVAISERPQTGVMTVGLITALWSASAAMGAVVNALNRARGVEETRPWWRVRLLSLFLTTGLALFVLLSIALVLAGPQAADLLTRWFGLGALFSWTWKIVQWPIAFALVATGIGLIYHFAPNTRERWDWLRPGSLVATTLWLLGSLAFRVYVVRFGTFEATYGTLGGVIVLMLWFYVTGLAIVIGVEIDAEIERITGQPRRRA